jgi:hypothetical protein
MKNIVPNEYDWGNFKADLELEYAHKIFFGKSNQNVQADFYRSVIERTSELEVMPRPVFQYYMLGFKDFMEAAHFQEYSDSDAASCFLNLVERKLSKKADDIMPIIDELLPTIEFVARNQDKFNAYKDIFGDFEEQFLRIKLLISNNQSNRC